MSKSQSSHSIVVAVPIRTAYNQWTQFEEFPKFMGGVELVRQAGPDVVHFVVNIAGRRVEYDAQIVEQEPDQRIVWRSIAGKKTGGMVSFRPIDANHTEVTLDMMYEPEGVLENVGDLVGLVSMRTRSDLQNFKQFIESRREETGAWRGEIHPGEPVRRTGGLTDQPSDF
jgi:uncharacterized membrane protein